MKSKSLVLGALALGCLVALPSVAEAQQPSTRAPRCNNFRAIARAVQLSPAQAQQTQVIYNELRQAVEPLQGQIPPLREALEALLDADAPVAADVGQVVIDIDFLHDQIEGARAAADAEFEALLSPEQVTRWERFQAACRQGYQR